jgi:hypothetical protein
LAAWRAKVVRHVGQVGELGGVVGADVAVGGAVGVEPPELADQFEGDDLGVGQRRAGAAGAQLGQVQGLEFVVHQTEYPEQEFLRGHGGSSENRRVVPSIYGEPPPSRNTLHVALANDGGGRR